MFAQIYFRHIGIVFQTAKSMYFILLFYYIYLDIILESKQHYHSLLHREYNINYGINSTINFIKITKIVKSIPFVPTVPMTTGKSR